MSEDSTIAFVRSHRADERPRHRHGSSIIFKVNVMIIIAIVILIAVAIILQTGDM